MERTVDKTRSTSTSVPTAVRELREWLGGDADHAVSQERFGRLLGVSWRTVARWEAGKDPDPDNASKLRRLSRVKEALADVISPEHRLGFLEARHPLINRLRPIDLLETPEGEEAVLEQIEGAKTGSFA